MLLVSQGSGGRSAPATARRADSTSRCYCINREEEDPHVLLYPWNRRHGCIIVCPSSPKLSFCEGSLRALKAEGGLKAIFLLRLSCSRCTCGLATERSGFFNNFERLYIYLQLPSHYRSIPRAWQAPLPRVACPATLISVKSEMAKGQPSAQRKDRRGRATERG